MKRLRWACLGLGGFLLLCLLATKIVHLTWNHEKAGRTISRWVSESLAGQGGPTQQAFTFGRVDYPWWGAVRSLVGGKPVRFDAYDIHIWDPEGKEVLYASHVTAGLRLHRLVGARLWGMLPGTDPDLELHFVDGVVDGVRCRIQPGSDGRVNIVAAFSARKPKPGSKKDDKPSSGGMVISVAGSIVKDGQFRMQFPAWEMDIEHFHMRHDSLRYSSFPSEQRPDSPAFTYAVSYLEAPTGNLTIHGYAFPLDHLVATDFHALEPRRQDMVFRGTSHSWGSTVAAAGRIRDIYHQDRNVDLHLDARHGAGPLAHLPSKKYLSGDPSATAHIHGPFTDVVIEGDTHGADLHVAGIDVDNLGAHYRLAQHEIALTDVTSDVAGGHARGKAGLDWKAYTWTTDIELEGIKTLQLGKLAPVEILAYLAGIPFAVFHAGENTEHLKLVGIDIVLHRHARDPMPHALSLRGHW